MQNSNTLWRIDFARKLAGDIIPFQGVRAIVVAGSVARGYADEYSDVEIPIFWNVLPDDAQRHAIVRALNAEFLYAYDGPSAEDQLLINGVQIDLWHVTVADEEAVIEAVLEGRNLDLGSLNALDTVRSCISLYGHDIVERWKDRAQAYPDELAERLVRDHIVSFRVADLFIQAARDNPTVFYGQLSQLHQELFLVLLALNRCYFPTFKWLYRALDAMPLKPEAIDLRLRRAFTLPYAEAIADTRQLLEETLALVELQFPHLDTTQIHRRLAYTRTAHRQPLFLVAGAPKRSRDDDAPHAYTFLTELFADLCGINLNHSEKTHEESNSFEVVKTGWRGTPEVGCKWTVTAFIDDSSQTLEHVSGYNLPGIEFEWSFSWWKSGYAYRFEHTWLEIRFADDVVRSRFSEIWERVFGTAPVFSTKEVK
ncbi:MAG: nucleotidyltransferase domain-containing protein [Anaerolineae bacterium]|nr:nucleotidyltransferase domain-containing protein [Anaerolineae bacterium]